MALCDPCYDLFCILERDHIPRNQRRGQAEAWEDEEDDFPSATAFRDWLHGRLSSLVGRYSIPKVLPQLSGLIHSSWDSFCKSLDSFCPVCWIVWRHIRESPMSVYRDEVPQGFYLYFDGGFDLTNVSGILELQCYDIKDCEDVVVRFKRTTKQRFEEIVTKTTLEDHMGSESTVDAVKNWLSKCDSGHSHRGDGCVAKRRAVNNSTIPTRLIDIHSHDSQAWSLIETNSHNSIPKYVALSHRWTTNTPRLLRGNYPTFQRDQPDKTLPRSYQDVFILCRRLGIQYVWIDSLCIFQDSADDFLHEAATMTEVYANAFCAFSICWESPCGFLRPREQRELARWDVRDQDLSALSDRYVFVQDQSELRTAIDQAPVNRRGWVLQEQLLSPRVLYLGNDQFYWQCDEATACETTPINIRVGPGECERKDILARKSRNYPAWQDLLVRFMGRDLTFERDRLLAISGIARFLLSPIENASPVGSNPGPYSEKTEKSDQVVQYVAGLQRAHWIEDLLWYPPVNAAPLSTRRPAEFVPSWSWAACPGPIRWRVEYPMHLDAEAIEMIPESDGSPLAYLQNMNFEPLGSDVYGLPKSASLEISCLLTQAQYAVLDNLNGYYRSIEVPADQPKRKCFHIFTDGFLLPLPYPRTHSDDSSILTVSLEPCADFVPTCFIVPLLHARIFNAPRIIGLVVQERPQSDSIAKMREFVRIGSFSKSYDLGDDELISALLKNLPIEGDEFEQQLRDSAQAWKGARRTGETGTAKAEWTTIRLV